MFAEYLKTVAQRLLAPPEVRQNNYTVHDFLTLQEGKKSSTLRSAIHQRITDCFRKHVISFNNTSAR